MLRKAFANGSSANIKLSKTQLSKIEHLGKYLGSILHLSKIQIGQQKNSLKIVAI